MSGHPLSMQTHTTGELSQASMTLPLARLQTFLHVTQQLASAHDLERKPYAIVKAAAQLMQASYGQFWEVDCPRHRVRLITCFGEKVSDPFPHSQFAFGESKIGWVAQHRQQIYLTDLRQENHEAMQAWYQRYRLQSGLAVPLQKDDHTVAAVLGLYYAVPVQLDACEQALLDGFTFRASMVLRNIGMAFEAQAIHQAQARQAERLRTLTRLHQVISASLDLEEVLPAIVRAAAVLMETPMVSIWIADEASQTLVLRAFSKAELATEHPVLPLRFGQGGVGWVAEHRQPLQVHDIFSDPRFVNKMWWQRHQLCSFYGMPILRDHKLLAILALHGAQPWRFLADDADLLEHFATQAAIAFRNASLYTEAIRAREEAEMAVKLKNDLLTRLLQGELPAVTTSASLASPRQLHLLVVEDNAINRQVVVHLLEQAGHVVSLALHGKEALTLLQAEHFDAILMDIQIPEIDGLETTRRIRAQERHTGAHVPIIAMTAYGIHGDRERCLAAGMDDYLTKPIRAAALSQVLAQVINRYNTPGARVTTFPMEIGEALKNAAGDVTLLRELGRLFLVHVPQQMENLRLALQQGKVQEVGRAAHTLKGSVNTLGAHAVRHLLERLEMLARAEMMDEMARLLPVVEQEIARLTAWLSLSDWLEVESGSCA